MTLLLQNSLPDVVLENFTVVPDSFSSVLLEWRVTPSDGYHCIRNYNIQITGPNGSQWEEEIPGSNHSFHFTGIQLIRLQNYTCCVTAMNLDHNQITSIKQTITVELQGELMQNYQHCKSVSGSGGLNAFIRKADLDHLIDVFGNYIANVLFHLYIYRTSNKSQCRDTMQARV